MKKFLRGHSGEILAALVWLAAFIPLPDGGLAWGWVVAYGALLGIAAAVNAFSGGERGPGRRRFMLILLVLSGIAFLARIPGRQLGPARYLHFAILPLYALGSTGQAPPGLLLLSVLVPEAARRLLWPGGEPSIEATVDLIAFFGVLAAATFGVSAMATRRNRKAERIKADYDRLRTNAEALAGMGEQAKDDDAPPVGAASRQSRWAGISLKLDRKIDDILHLVVTTLGADHAALFERNPDGEHLTLRALVPATTETPETVHLPLSAPLIGSVVAREEPIILGRLKAGSISYLPKGARIRSLAMAPVSPFGPLMGLLAADAARDDAFAGRMDALTGFAGQIADVYLTDHQVSRAEEEDGYNEVLRMLSNTLAGQLREQDIVTTLLDETAAQMGHKRSAYLAVDDGGTAVLKAARGIDGALPGSTHPLKSSLLGTLVGEPKPYIFNNLDLERNQTVVLWGLPLRCRSLMVIPLVTDDRLSGIFLAADDQPGYFYRAHRDLMGILANQVAAQLANATLHERVERMAMTDGLTGLYNHRHFHECLEHELARTRRTGEQLSLIILDIDHFKKVNDTHGHPFGDVVLKGVAAHMKSLAREVDVVARYGGEEMAILLVNTGRDGTESFACRLMEGLRKKRYPKGDIEVKVTASLGGATFPLDASSGADLVHAADQALYHSKQTGRDRFTAAGSYAAGGGTT